LVNLFSQIKSWAVGKIQDVSQLFAFVPDYLRITWPTISFLSLLREGFKGSSAVSGCVRALANTFPEPPLVVYENVDQPVDPRHPLQKLLNQPNADMGMAEFLQFCVVYASIGGNVYIIKIRNRVGQVIALWPFSDRDITPVPGHNPTEGFVAGYEFDPGDGQKIYFSKHDVIQWKWQIDPEFPWRGIGAIELCWRDISSDNETSRYTYAMLKNNAVPPVAVTLAPGEILDDARYERLAASWMKKYGKNGRGIPAFLENGMTVQTLGFNMQELNLSELKNIPESRICANFGVPPTIALLYVGLKRSDYGDGEARRSFAEATLVALWRSYCSELTSGLQEDFGDQLTIMADLTKVKALQEKVNELWDRLTVAVNNGLIMRAEWRRGTGYPVTERDNVYRTNLINGWEPATAAPGNPADAMGASKMISGKSYLHKEVKAVNAVYARSLQRIRLTTSMAMQADVDRYFGTLADRIVSRAEKSLKTMNESKTLPKADDLLTEKDATDLVKLIKKWFVAVAQASWETINLALGVTIDFDLTDPAITTMLSKSSADVKEITATTRDALRAALKYGNDNGWSISQLVNGDENQPGIQSIVTETYAGRAKTIARTELGTAQNAVTTQRYGANGVSLVGVLDNGDADDDDACKIANGQIWTLEYANNNALEHPNCTRCFYPVFDNITPDRS
jgi:HK97 family phage portal protein